MTTHLEYLKQLVESDERNIRGIAAGQEVSVSGSSPADAVARWLAREWALCEAFAIVRYGYPNRELKRWRTSEEEDILFDTGHVFVVRTSREQVRFRVYSLDQRDMDLGPLSEAYGQLASRSGRFLISRPLPPSRMGYPDKNLMYT